MQKEFLMREFSCVATLEVKVEKKPDVQRRVITLSPKGAKSHRAAPCSPWDGHRSPSGGDTRAMNV